MTIRATDGDAPSNANMVYKIVNEDGINSVFEIDSRNGLVRIRERPDRETRAQYKLIVEADDQGKDPHPLTATATVQITVEDENDNYPQFSEKRYEVQVPENVAVNTKVIQVEATDKDEGNNAKVQYSIISGNIKGQFYINSEKGEINVINPLDYEMIREETTDFYTFAIVSIMVLDVNDNVPAFTEKTYSLKINEDAVVGTSVLTVTAVDRDINSVVTYQIFSGNTRNRFSITSQSGGGLITLALPLDYKQERQYVLTVMASDGTLYDTAQIFINVSDANTHRPVFQTSGNLQVLLGEEKPIGSFVTMITATDDDTGENARITYVMEDNVPQFKIDPDTGVITTQMEIDYEHQASYTLAIIARDNGIPQKSDTTYVEIRIEDANDNAPIFNKDIYKGSVLEDAPIQTSVLQIVGPLDCPGGGA
uniref:Cadherin domain-containing protein n=1 Tax=Xiphophorus couchianus TaxID=32473 RepID=A0A3B5M9F6_9TELE